MKNRHTVEKVLLNMQRKNWEIIGILNNDMIGNIEGVDGVIDNKSFRIFLNQCLQMRVEIEEMLEDFMAVVDGNSRQLARFIYSSTKFIS